MTDDITIPLPHAVQVEKAVLSVLMKDPANVEKAPELSEGYFYFPANQIVYRKIIEAGQGFELISFVQRLHDSGDLEAIGGPSAIYEIFTYAPSSAHFGNHVGILREKLIRRKALLLAGSIEKAAYEAESVEELISATSAPVTELHDMASGAKPTEDSRATLSRVMKEFRELCEGKKSPMGIETSLAELNGNFRGLHPGHTVVISGYPGGGKTTLGGQLAMDAASDGHNTLICSLEMSSADLMRRMIAYVARLPGDAITDPLRYSREVWNANAVTTETLSKIQKAVKSIADAPFEIQNLVGSNVHQIAAAIRKAHRKAPLKVAMVDFVQRIRSTPEKVKESREQQLAQASNLLADLAKELGVCLILPSQLNKDGAAKHAEAINEDADLHLQILQDKATKEHTGLGVIKDRHHGKTGETLGIVLAAPMIRFIPKSLTK